ncbi:Protein-L-isoaspartate O-methyltransferase [Planctomycetes bacterium Pan216]|uniref:Protein-L-isoaspartate O-methyltransferase n=1 Tax=Kolteria novifilia TaxID=2527975 RepID=A0A518AZE2_9BACT|nr:Protein-L-isoaspartate O-methyltransferase [Planctomycetes bacterium Pan216]
MADTEAFADQRSDLIRELQRDGIRDHRVLSAIDHVPRELFVPPMSQHRAYANEALGIGSGQTISQPYIVALMTESLALEAHHRVLEIGTGSGYQTAILATLAGEVFTVERLAELSLKSETLLAGLGFRNVRFKVSDGTIGWPDQAPFDRIIVTAAAPEVPESLLGQLAEGGVLVIPFGKSDVQKLTRFTKVDGQVHATELCDCRFVRLIGNEGWPAP